MRLPKGAKPSRVPLRGAEAGYRPVLSGAYLETENNNVAVLYATDSYTFLRLPIAPMGLTQGDRPEPGPIPRQALQHMERGVEFHAGEEGVRVGLATYDRVFAEGGDSAAKYPEFEPLVPTPEQTYTVALNADLLADLAAGMGVTDRGVVLTFDADQMSEAGYLRAFTVTRLEDHGRRSAFSPLGLMMPMRVPL